MSFSSLGIAAVLVGHPFDLAKVKSRNNNNITDTRFRIRNQIRSTFLASERCNQCFFCCFFCSLDTTRDSCTLLKESNHKNTGFSRIIEIDTSGYHGFQCEGAQSHRVETHAALSLEHTRDSQRKKEEETKSPTKQRNAYSRSFLSLDQGLFAYMFSNHNHT